MKVRQLIEELAKVDQELDVVFCDSEYGFEFIEDVLVRECRPYLGRQVERKTITAVELS